jgi:hypothetical protein
MRVLLRLPISRQAMHELHDMPTSLPRTFGIAAADACAVRERPAMRDRCVVNPFGRSCSFVAQPFGQDPENLQR